MKPDFQTMPRKDLIAYVLSHREDQEAFDILLSRRSPDDQATWYSAPDTEEGMNQLKEVFRRRIDGDS